MNNGRDKLDWSQDIWNRIDQAVHDEAERIKVASKFIPLYGPVLDALTVPSDTVTDGQGVLSIDEGATTRLVEIWIEFTLTPQQVEREGEEMTARTLAERATNLLSQAEDVLLFQGENAVNQHPLFQQRGVRHRSGPAGTGLLGFGIPGQRVIDVQGRNEQGNRYGYGEETARAVALGYARLQNAGHYGPYALALPTVPYADTYAPLENTLIMPADRIKPLVTAGFYGSGTLPDVNNVAQGVLVSLGGNTMDLVMGRPPTVAFVQEDTDGMYRFRVFERFALRLKDQTAVLRLDFQPQAVAGGQQSREASAVRDNS